MKRFCLLLMLFLGVVASGSAREIYSLNSGWKFFYMEENSSDNAREVTIPHTWNLDAFVGNGSYRQTSANYLRNLYIPSEWQGKRLFLRFRGVQSVADVFINGRHVGDHYGGYTAFTFEITDNVSFGGNNSLLVAVSNAYRNDVLPTSTEENVYGGIYRDVELIVTDDAVLEVAKKAITLKTGARGLRTIFENLMLDVMYYIPSDKEIQKVIIDKDVVLGLKEPQIIKREIA